MSSAGEDFAQIKLCLERAAHFNDLQYKYRTLAVGMLTAWVIGIGFIFELNVMLDARVFLLALASTVVGFALLAAAVFDHDYSKLIAGVFEQGFQVEVRSASPFAQHLQMKAELKWIGVGYSTFIFYLVAALAVAAASFFCLLGYADKVFGAPRPELVFSTRAIAIAGLVCFALQFAYQVRWLFDRRSANSPRTMVAEAELRKKAKVPRA